MWRRTARASWSGGSASVQPSSRGQALLVRVAGADEHRRRARGSGRWRPGGDERAVTSRPERAGAETATTSPVGDRRAEHGVHGAGHRLDGDRVGVAQAVGHRVELARVGDEARRSTSRRRCRRRSRSAGPGGCARRRRGRSCRPVPAWQAGHGGSMPRAAHPSTGCRTTRLPAASARAVGADGVLGRRCRPPRGPGTKGKRDDVLEVARAAPVERGQVRPADAREHGVDVDPPLGRAASGASRSTRRSGPTPAPRPDPNDDDRRGRRRSGAASARRASVLIGPSPPWATSRRTGPSGSGRCEPPSALAQCSTCQPRRRAMADSRDSGLTATGKPTASSMARSLAESA